MSESDQTGTPEDRDPTQPTPVEPAAPWPQYTWPPTVEGASDAPSPAPASPADEPATEPVWASWPPTQPTPAASGPYATDPYATDPYAAAPAPGPNPYSYDPNAGYGGAWGPAPPGGGWSPVAPPPQRPTPPTATKTRRGVAILATLALVLASAGVGAGVAIALHRNSDTRTFDTAGNNSIPPSNNNGLGGNGGLGNGNSGTTIPATGTLDVNAIASKVNSALVNINTTLAQGRAAGTGMLISSTGEILTNNHVIAEATSIKVTPGGTGPSYNAKVIGYDITEDVALLQITDRVSNLPTVTFGEPSKVQIGDPVVAIGNALGQGGTPKATQGRVTALDQQVTAGDSAGTQETLVGMIQINAPIQPGDSGGALVDRNARVIGMNTAAAGGGRFNPQVGSSIGFAIPIDNAVSIVSQIRTGTDTDKVHIGDRALIGVQVQDINGQSAPVSSGALIVGVQDNTGASAAGMKKGDVLVSVDGKPIADSAALRLILAKLHPGNSVSVGWVDSAGTRHDANIKLVVGPPL
jgi:S1-C subfamily serine protease